MFVRFDDLIRPECIAVPLTVGTRELAVDKLVDLLARQNLVNQPQQLARQLFDREARNPTHFKPGIAFPHVPSEFVSGPCVAAANLAAPVEWPGADKHVKLVFLLVIPESDQEHESKFVSLMNEILGWGTEVHTKLRQTQNAVEFLNVLRGIDIDVGVPAGFRLRHRFLKHKEQVCSLAWSRDGSQLASVGHHNDSVVVWNTRDREKGEMQAVMMGGHTELVNACCWSPDGKTLATASLDKTIQFWDVGSQTRKKRVNVADELFDLAWHPSGDKLATACHRLMVRLYSSEGRYLRWIKTEAGISYSVCWSPDGRWLAAGIGRKTTPCVRIWKMETGDIEVNLSGLQETVYRLAWSPNGRMLAAGTASGFVAVYDTQTWQQIIVFRAHQDDITALDFSFDSMRLATKSKGEDARVRLWQTESWQQIASLPDPCNPSMLFTGLAFHPGQHCLATLGNEGKSVRIWDLDFATIENHANSVAGGTEEKNSAAEKHVFLSYFRENKAAISKLRDDLINAGETVWWDQDILGGHDWEMEIHRAMQAARAVVVCFSSESDERVTSGVYPELLNAIEAFQQHAPGGIFLIPVRLSECQIPLVPIGGGRTLDRLNYIDLFEPGGLDKLVRSIRASSHRHP